MTHYPLNTLSIDTKFKYLQQLFSEKGIVGSCKSMVRAVAEVHKSGLIHNDIHLKNLVLVEIDKLEFFIIDFNGASFIEETAYYKTYFEHGGVVVSGLPSISSDSHRDYTPELRTPNEKYHNTCQGDLYSVGRLFYQFFNVILSLYIDSDKCPISKEKLEDPVAVPCCHKVFSKKSLLELEHPICPYCGGNLDVDKAPKFDVTKNMPLTIDEISKQSKKEV